jgi:peptide/nickel transport system ATP-binding protein
VVGRPLTEPEAKGTELPDPLNPPDGCPFAARCPKATDICRREDPPLERMGEDQFAACHHPLEP